MLENQDFQKYMDEIEDLKRKVKNLADALEAKGATLNEANQVVKTLNQKLKAKEAALEKARTDNRTISVTLEAKAAALNKAHKDLVDLRSSYRDVRSPTLNGTPSHSSDRLGHRSRPTRGNELQADATESRKRPRSLEDNVTANSPTRLEAPKMLGGVPTSFLEWMEKTTEQYKERLDLTRYS